MDEAGKTKVTGYLDGIAEAAEGIRAVLGPEGRTEVVGGEITYNGKSVRGFFRSGGKEYSFQIYEIAADEIPEAAKRPTSKPKA